MVRSRISYHPRHGMLLPLVSLCHRRLLLLALLCLVGSSTAQDDECTLTLHVYDNSEDCQNRLTPDTVGTIRANGQCGEADAIRGASRRLPGVYTAECVAEDRVAIYNSGCLFSDCSMSPGRDTCDREFTLSSLYARLETPEFLVQSERAASTSSRQCFVLRSNDDSMSITFFITGDCSSCQVVQTANDGDDMVTDDAWTDDTGDTGDTGGSTTGDDDDDGDSNNGATTSAPTAQSGVSPGTFEPIPAPVQTPQPTPAPVASTPAPVMETPAPVSITPAPVQITPAPVRSTPAPIPADPAPVEQPVQQPVARTPAPTAQPTRAVRRPTPQRTPTRGNTDDGTDDGGLVDTNDDITFAPTPLSPGDSLSPTEEPLTRFPTIPSGVTSPDVAPPSNTSSQEAPVGLIAGVAVGVVAVLVIVLLAGFALGKRLRHGHYNDKDFERSLADRAQQRPYGGTPDTSYVSPTDRFIEIDRQDEVSILEDPTIFTKDNTVTKMMREAEDQETMTGLETIADASLQVEDNTVDRTVWSKNSL